MVKPRLERMTALTDRVLTTVRAGAETTLTGQLALHSYQERARAFLEEHDRSGVFLDLGLGKTAICLSALRPEQLPALVVAPKRVAEHVWPVEQPKWRPDLTLALAAGSPAQRAHALSLDRDITVIGRDNIADVRRQYRTVILDELSGFKDKTTTRWKTARKLVAKAPYRWGLSGTPAPNGLLDLWAQLYLLDDGQRLGKSLTGYRSRYFFPGRTLPSGVIIEWIMRDEAEPAIHRLVEDICMYMSAEDELDLPPVKVNPIPISLPPSTMSQYKEFKRELVLDLEDVGLDIFTAANAAVLSNKLQQVTAGFVYSDDGTGSYSVLHKEKLHALREIVEGTGDNVLVFYWYKAEAEMIRQAFPEAKMLDDKGAIPDWCAGKVRMMLAHPASAGHGLNLQTGGHTAVWTTIPWDLELWLQANGRLNRQGQTHPVIIHTLQAEKTVDLIAAERLETKEFVQSRLLEHLK